MPSKKTSRVLVVGAGFGGLNVARSLARAPVEITILDRKNHHTFQPLLYQVATGGLSPGEIAAPIRAVFRRDSNVATLLEEVQDFDLARRIVKTSEQELFYDYLVVAAGATHAYFGHDDWEPYAPGLKTIEDALEIRRRVLLAFELAERRALSGAGDEPLNFVVVGGGPTGVELAGILAEIARHVLAHEFRWIDPSRARIVLLEGGPRVLPAYAEDLSRSAEEQLRHLGVDVRTNAMVTLIEPGVVHVGDTCIVAPVVLWAAGVAASPLGKRLGVPCDRAGRVLVQPDLSIPGHPEVFVIGDLASIKDKDGKPVPGLAPAAMQEGKYVAKADPPRSTRQAPQALRLLGQGHAGHHRSQRRHRPVRQNSHLRIHRLAVVAVHSHLLSHRIPQSPAGLHSVVLVVRDLRTQRTPDHG